VLALCALCTQAVAADRIQWSFDRALVVCTASINSITARCNGGQFVDEVDSIPSAGWCPSGEDFCGYEVELFQYATACGNWLL
jgi:hypothetical protein